MTRKERWERTDFLHKKSSYFIEKYDKTEKQFLLELEKKMSNMDFEELKNKYNIEKGDIFKLKKENTKGR